LTAAELPPGYEYVGELDLCLQAGTQSNYLALLQDYEIDSPRGKLGITVAYAALESKRNAAVAFRTYPASIKNYRPEELIVGDRTWGKYPSFTCILQDRAVVSISINPRVGYNDEGLDEDSYAAEIAPYADALSGAVVRKLDSMGYHKSAPFELSLAVASDTVGPISDAAVSLRGHDVTVFPLSFFGEVRTSDTIVFKFPKSAAAGEFTYRWDGVDASGQRVPPGVYLLEIGAFDVLGRTSTVETVPITVVDSPPAPSNETLPSSKDTLVYERETHANEGANPRLTLEKITGKAARNLLGFDLSGVDISSLTKATLVLTIDPSDQVTGWGNGETVSVKPLTVAWQEGNGKKHGLPGSQQTAGSGAGATWFGPIDENISNDSSNGVVQWSGGATYATTGATPPLVVRNQQTGELRFDVTQDILNGAEHGWLLRKDAENRGSKVSFYSREGSATLGPRLILEYGDLQAATLPRLALGGLSVFGAAADFFGLSRRHSSLQASAAHGEGPRRIKDFLRGSARSAYVGEQVLLGFAGRHPLAQLGTRLAYRSWLRETPSLV
jgi:hypothetical protein